jgi:uncharacterized protein (DUF488 family)
MIFSIGYQRITPAYLDGLLRSLGAQLVDVRGGKGRSKAGFGCRQLETLLGPGRYQWRGDCLGNRGTNHVTENGLNWLRDASEVQGRTLMLMCMEEAPGDCHRHFQVAMGLLERGWGDVRHIYQDEVVSASELERSIREKRDYCFLPLSKWQSMGHPDVG